MSELHKNDPRPTPGDAESPGMAGVPSAGGRVALIALMNWSRFAVMLGVSLLMTPMLIGILRFDLFGLYMFFNLVRFALQDFTQPFLTRELGAAWASDSSEVRRRAFSSAFGVSLLAAGIALVLSGGAVWLGPVLLNVPDGSLWLVRLMILCECAMLVPTLAAGPWINMFIASHRVVENNIHRTLERVQDLVVAGIALYILRVGDVVTVFLAGRVVFRAAHILVCVVRARAQQPDARVSRASVDRAMVGHYSAVMKWSAALPVSNQFYWYIDQALLNAFLGPVFNGIYGLVNTLRGYERILGGGLFYQAEALTADMHERGRHDFNRRLLLSAVRSTVAIVAFCTAIITVFTGPIISAWLGQKLQNDPALLEAHMSLDDVIVLVWRFAVILAPVMLVIEGGCTAQTILFGVGRLRDFAPGLLVMTALKVLLTWLGLAVFTGSLGRNAMDSAAWATALTSVAMYGVYLPLLIRRVMGVGVRELYRRAYLWPVVSVVPVALVGIAMARFLGPWPHGAASLLKLAACWGILGLLWLPLAAWLIPEEYERERVFGVLTRIGGRFPGGGLVLGGLRRAWKL